MFAKLRKKSRPANIVSGAVNIQSTRNRRNKHQSSPSGCFFVRLTFGYFRVSIQISSTIITKEERSAEAAPAIRFGVRGRSYQHARGRRAQGVCVARRHQSVSRVQLPRRPHAHDCDHHQDRSRLRRGPQLVLPRVPV